jgi:hypothetical protein
MFQMFRLFHSYIAASGFMLSVISVLFGCFMYFIHMLHVHVPNVLSILRHMLHLNIFFMLQMFYVVGLGASGGPTDGGAAVGARWAWLSS